MNSPEGSGITCKRHPRESGWPLPSNPERLDNVSLEQLCNRAVTLWWAFCSCWQGGFPETVIRPIQCSRITASALINWQVHHRFAMKWWVWVFLNGPINSLRDWIFWNFKVLNFKMFCLLIPQCMSEEVSFSLKPCRTLWNMHSFTLRQEYTRSALTCVRIAQCQAAAAAASSAEY